MSLNDIKEQGRVERRDRDQTEALKSIAQSLEEIASILRGKFADEAKD